MRKHELGGECRSTFKNRFLVMAESALTAGLISMAIMTPFYREEIGLNQKAIAMTQIAFTLIVILFDIAAGWLADRFSRKWANIIGDLIVGIGHLLYSRVTCFWQIVACEVFLGIGICFSQGVDTSLLKHFCDKEDESGKLFRSDFAKMNAIMQVTSLLMILLGGPLAAISYRTAIAASAVPLFIGAIISCFIDDDSEKLQSESKSAIADIWRIIKKSWRNKKLRWRLIAYAIGREVTHGIIWVFSPLMLAVGVPISLVSLGWAFNYVGATIGSLAAKRYESKMPNWLKFIAPIAILSVSSIIIVIHPSILTMTLVATFGLSQGWSRTTLMPLVKEETPAAEQASVESFAHTIAKVIYTVSLYLINAAADVKLTYSLLATVAIFLPFALVVARQLRAEE